MIELLTIVDISLILVLIWRHIVFERELEQLHTYINWQSSQLIHIEKHIFKTNPCYVMFEDTDPREKINERY